MFRLFSRRGPAARQPTRASVALTLIVAIMVWVADCAGWLSNWDGAIYDACVNVKNTSARAPAASLLCYVDPGMPRDSDRLSQFLNTLLDFQPRAIVLTFPWESPDGVGARESGIRVISPTDLRQSPLVTSDTEKQTSESFAVFLSPSQRGVHRWHSTWVGGRHERVPTIEVIAADALGAPVDRLPERFRINFRGPAGSLPFVTAEQVLSHKVVPEMITGKLIMIGMRDVGPYAGLHTPTTSPEFLMTPLEYHGHVLNSLVTGRTITDIPTFLQFAMLISLAVLMPYTFWRSRLGPGAIVVCGTSCIVVLASFLLLRAELVWLRPGAMLLVCWLSCCVIWETQIERLHRKTRSFCLDITTEQRRLEWPSQFVSAENPWDEIAKLIRELLNPQRCILLGPLKGQMYVRATKAMGCEFGDIVERRRDFRRDPYLHANDEGGPVFLNAQFPFLNFVDGESQVITPMKFRGELMGFAVLGMNESALARYQDFVKKLRELSDEAAKMLHRHRELEKTQGALDPSMEMGLASWDTSLAAAELASRRMRSNIDRLDGVLLAAPTPALVFDVYGNLLLANRKMDELLAVGRVSDRATTMEMLAEFWQGPEDQLRGVLRQLVATQETHVRSVTLDGSPYFLHLSPVAAKPGGVLDDVYPFDLIGIRLDLIPALGGGTVVDWLTAAEEDAQGDKPKLIAVIDDDG